MNRSLKTPPSSASTTRTTTSTTPLDDFVSAYNFARRLKTLRGLTLYEFICKTWMLEPTRPQDPFQVASCITSFPQP